MTTALTEASIAMNDLPDGASAEVPSDSVLGIRIARLDVAGAARCLAARPAEAPFAYVVTPNAQHIVRLEQGDEALRAAYEGAWLRLCDSQILRFLTRLLFGLRLPLASGSDLTAHLFAHHITPDVPITVIGGGAELAERLRARFGLTRLALHNPPMGFYNDPGEMERCVRFVLDHPARYVFLAVGAPQSERLALDIRNAGGTTGIGLCVGSSLLFVTGMVKRAPPIVRRCGMEWMYRLVLNPRGHFRRVFVDSLPLLGILGAAWLSDRFGRNQPARVPRP